MATKKSTTKSGEITERPLKIFLVGGGSGGHITPLINLAKTIRRSRLNWQITYIGARRDVVGRKLIQAQAQFFYDTRFLVAGKFRRYTFLKRRQRWTMWQSQLQNIGDLFLAVVGFIHCCWLMAFRRPDLVFSKGGYPALGPCFAAILWRVPLIVHDSDAVAGLTHRLVGRWAQLRLTGVPTDNKDLKWRYVGVPINKRLSQQLSPKNQRRLEGKYRIPAQAKVILITGGGQGSSNLNVGLLKVIDRLRLDPNNHIVLVTGQGNYSEATEFAQKIKRRHRLTLINFADDMVDLIRLSQIVVTRAGATALAEVAAAAKPVIVVPNPWLPFNHQVHNAQAYQQAKAAVMVADNGQEVNQRALIDQLNELINSASKRAQLSRRIKGLASTKATRLVLGAIKEVLAKKQPPTRKSLVDQDSDRYYTKYRNLSTSYSGSLIRLTALENQSRRILRGRLIGLAIIVVGGFLAFRVIYVSDIILEFETKSRLVGDSQRLQLQATSDQALSQQSHFNRLIGQSLVDISRQLSQFDYIRGATIERDFWNLRAKLSLTPKQVLGVLEVDDRRVIITDDGFALIDYPKLSQDPELLTIVSQVPVDLVGGDDQPQPLFSASEIDFIVRLSNYLASVDLKIDQFVLSENPRELIVKLVDYDFEILTLIINDPLEQGIAIELTLAAFEDYDDLDYPKEYLDTRLIDRAVYK